MLVIDKESKITLYEQIYNQLREQIASGTIPEKSILPSTRNLAKTLRVSRNTVENAYSQLFAEGYISSRAGSGYKVEKIEWNLCEEFNPNNGKTTDWPAEEKHQQPLSNAKGLDFQYGRLRPSDFPHRIFRKLANQVLLSPDLSFLSSYNDRNGELELREEILKYLHDSRGVKCKPEQIILCSGTLSCIGLLSQLLMKNLKSIAMEEPCYDSVRIALMNHGFKIEPVSVNHDGIDIEALGQSGIRAVYVTPSHQFPTGVVMPVTKRLSLIEWAVRNDAYILEDDYDSELRYNSRPIPSLQSLDSRGRVIYMNTFSKSFAPGLRLSFMVLPLSLVKEYQRYFNRYHCSVPWLEQKIMHAFMKEGHWSRHLHKICTLNKKRHDTLISTITDVMGDRVAIHGKNAGLHIILETNNGLTEKEMIESAAALGVHIYPVSCYYADLKNYPNNMVLIGFSSLDEEEIIKGIHLLRDAWF